uniref:Uncharacterized protein n=1 Tax=Rangifer tarandus platyrhynchus TaxID=3082113 RepID=A0ACB0FFY4_RANTA|nr:unnamed protein product [Rangifer tarandus platyrhynchus]
MLSGSWQARRCAPRGPLRTTWSSAGLATVSAERRPPPAGSPPHRPGGCPQRLPRSDPNISTLGSLGAGLPASSSDLG